MTTHNPDTPAPATTPSAAINRVAANADGATSPRPRTRPVLRDEVEAVLRDHGPGREVTAAVVARRLRGRGTAAIANALYLLTASGVLVTTGEAPARFTLADNAPAPTADVQALMTVPGTAPGQAAYVPAHGGMCPIGAHLVCADFNAMPQAMWRTDRQHWQCEGCGAPMVRTFTPATGWSPWRPAHH